MNTKTIATTFTITFAIVMLGSASVVPAFAATKVIEVKDTFTASGTDSICGVDANFNAVLTESYTEWDNGHYTSKGKFNIVFTDVTTGKLVGKYSTLLNGEGNVSDLPQTNQYNAKIICVGTGLVESLHGGFTLHQDGTVTIHHDV